ncbi:MAG: methionyl-tRNA formyltransferase [Planctomycetota bacterium]|nr:methionyl-tRNA formyltransferase [Planctomycetota bacterium]
MDELRVDIKSFQGPLDLLLYLVQQEEVDVSEVPIARIADRFLAICRGEVKTLDVDEASEFLVMASQLLVLKSRALLPRDEPVDLEEIDPRLDLVRQLLEYRKYKGVSSELAARWDAQLEKAPIRLSKPKEEAPAQDELLELDLYGLVSTFARLLKETGGDTVVHMAKERLPITHFVGQIFDQLTQVGGRTNFRGLLGPKPDRTIVIGAFLALLELMKLNKVRVMQDGLGDIYVEIRPEALTPAGEEPGDAAAHLIDDIELEDHEYDGPRIVYMGSPDFAVPALRSLVGAGMTPRLIVTPPPRRAGRGRRMQQVPLAQEADTLQIPLHRTNDVNGRTSRDEIEHVKPDLIITAGFGQKLGAWLLALPEHGCVNLHTSVLPAYRGASPVAAAVRDGLTETGVTIFKMDAQMDRGPVLASRTVPIGSDDTTDVVTAHLADAAADLLVRTLPAYLDGSLVPVEQDHESATYVGRLAKEDGLIDWSLSATAVRNHIRSVTSWPGAQTAWKPKVKHEPLALLVLEAQVLEAADVPAGPLDPEGVPVDVKPGTILAVSAEGLDVACAEGVLRVSRVRPAGGREMAVKDFLNARRVVAGDALVAPKPPVSAKA